MYNSRNKTRICRTYTEAISQCVDLLCSLSLGTAVPYMDGFMATDEVSETIQFVPNSFTAVTKGQFTKDARTSCGQRKCFEALLGTLSLARGEDN